MAQAVRDQDDASSASEHSENSEHSDSAHTPTPSLASPAQISLSARSTSTSVHNSSESASQHSTSRKSTSPLQDTAHLDSEQDINQPPTPNDYTSTDGSQTSGGDEWELDTYALTREFRRLKKVVNAQILHLKNKLKRLRKSVWPLVKHHRLWVKQQKKSGLKKKKKSKSKSKKKKLSKHSSFTLGRNMEEENLN